MMGRKKAPIKEEDRGGDNVKKTPRDKSHRVRKKPHTGEKPKISSHAEPPVQDMEVDSREDVDSRANQPKDIHLLFDIPDGDLIILTGTSTGGTTPLLHGVRVYSQMISNASTVLKSALSTDVVLDSRGGKRLTVSEPERGFFVELCKLLHSAEGYKHFYIPPPKDILAIVTLSTKYDCKGAIAYAVWAWLYRYHSVMSTMPGDDPKLKEISWYMTLVSIEFNSACWFYTWTGFFILRTEYRSDTQSAVVKEHQEICRLIREAAQQNAVHRENLKRMPVNAGMCLPCFRAVTEKPGKKNFVSHHDLSKCE